MGRRRIHTQGGAIDLSVLGQPQTTPMSMLSHPALMSNVGIHNVLQGIHSPLHPNALRSTGGDLKLDLKHLAYHHLQSGKRGHELMDDIYHSGRQLLGVGLYAEPHGGDLLDSIYNTGRHLLDSGIDGKPLVDMLLHGGKLNGNDILKAFSYMTNGMNTPIGLGLSAEPSGGDITKGLNKFGEVLIDKAGNRAVDMALSHLFGGQIPSPPSRSPITDPSLIGGKMRRMKGGNELTGGDIAPRKGRFVKGSAEAKAYMASIRKKSGKGVKGGALDIETVLGDALKFAPLMALL